MYTRTILNPLSWYWAFILQPEAHVDIRTIELMGFVYKSLPVDLNMC